MKNFFLIATAAIFFASCNNNNSAGTKTFCDTTCVKDSIVINGGTEQGLTVKINNCKPETVAWSDKNVTRRIVFNDYINKDVRMNPDYVKAAFQDSCVWLTFNDCFTGRGYMMRLPYSGDEPIDKMTAALNSFDKKFSVDEDLRAYTDGGNIYVVNVKTGQKAEMTFKEAYKMDYDNIHTVLDSINVSKSRVYVKLLEEGQEVPLEKNISL